ncbi:hypothetical protein MPSEU_000296900 [Mayamaea pseudoterrestris]|nr:hypothetical protein MPSEU_000296900 [Mayamaea pseudoterrestris]
MSYGDDEETALMSHPISPASHQSHTTEQQQSTTSTTLQQRRRTSNASRNSSNNNNVQSSAAASSTMTRTRRGSAFAFVTLLLLLSAATIVWNIHVQHQLVELSHELEHERDHVHQLDHLLEAHERVMERFNGSVTNVDVVSKLRALSKDVSAVERETHDELVRTQRDVTKQLNVTLSELSNTVAQAKRDIQHDVDKVKADVEQYVLTTQDQFSMENSFMVYQLAGTFTLLTCLISMWHMTAHLRKMNEPDVQRKILAILYMSPIYAVTSWFSLVFHSAEGYLAIIKDSYEAYVVYQFLAFCIAVIGKGDRNTVVDHLSKHADHLTPPFRLCGCFEICGCCVPDPYESNRALADAILTQCQVFALQFVLFRPLTTIGGVVCNQLGYYGAGTGPTDYRSPQFWFTVVQNISIFTAFAGLLKFYHAVDTELAWCRPFAKFLCIKGVVFMTFWQGLVISTVATMTDAGGDDAEEWAKSAQNFLICIEMLAFSIAHFYCFPTDEWQEGYRVKQSQSAFGDSIALGDFLNDVRLILSSSEAKTGSKKKKHLDNGSIPEGDERHDDDLESSPGTHVTANGSSSHDTQDDDTEAASVSTAEDNPRLALARALEESLGIAGDDPDIIEAKERLLASNILRPDFFDNLGDHDFGASFWQEPDANEHNTDTDRKNTLASGAITDADVEAITEPPHTPLHRSSSDDSDDDGDDLSSTDSNPDDLQASVEPLRPSVFTKIASIAESEQQAARKEEKKRQRRHRK